MKKTSMFLLIILFSFGCKTEPEAINYGSDECDFCKMVISNPKFGAELLTKKGKVYKFDSVECLAAFSLLKNKNEINSMWVTDYVTPEKFINSTRAFFLKSEIQSPMGLNLAAFADAENLKHFGEKYNGNQLNWESVVNDVKSTWK